MTRKELFVDTALTYNGAPYIWRGKGPDILTPEGKLVPNPYRHIVPFVFDCSGLVTRVLYEITQEDWRATHWTQRMFNELPGCAREDFAALWFYGADIDNISHVDIHIGNNFCVGSSGGGSATTTLKVAGEKGARVRARLNKRIDFIGARQLPL